MLELCNIKLIHLNIKGCCQPNKGFFILAIKQALLVIGYKCN